MDIQIEKITKKHQLKNISEVSSVVRLFFQAIILGEIKILIMPEKRELNVN